MAGLFFQNPPPTPNVSLFQQNNQPYQPQPPQNILPQVPVSDAQRMPLYNDLIGAKLGYETTNNALLKLNEELQNPKYNDDQRKIIQDNIALGEKALQGYGNYANFLRNSAGQLGIDIADYGSDRTAQQSAQALNNYAAGRVRDLLGLQTPRAQEEARYKELRDRGASPAQAHRILNREREGIQENYLSRLNDGLMTYGVNPDGSMNAYGMMLAQKMNPGSPETALTLFANGFATPKEVFNANNQANIWNNRLAQQRALELARERAKMAQIEAVQNYQRERDQYLQGQQNQRTAAEIQSRENIAGARLAADSPAGKFGQYYQVAISTGQTPEQALKYAMRQISKNGDDKPSEAQGIFNIYDTAFSFIAQGDEDSAGELLQSLEEDIASDRTKFFGKFSEEEQPRRFAMHEALKEYLNLKPTSNDPVEQRKQQAEAYEKFLAKYVAAKNGGDWREIFYARKHARAMQRHNSNSVNNNANKTYDDMEQADRRLREMLGNNNNDDVQIARERTLKGFRTMGQYGYPIVPR